MDFVTIGNSGNLGDAREGSDQYGIPIANPYGCGAVGYDYRIGKYEITNTQWNDFVAAAGKPTGSPSDAYLDIDACPDSRWRLIFALARYGGLRIPSELERLTWNDIMWDKKRFVVHSPKTEHIEGKESRIPPLFPELEPFLLEALEQSKPGQKHLIKAAQNPAQYLAESTRNETQENKLIEVLKVLSPEGYETLREVVKSFNSIDLDLIPPRGLEPLLPG